MDTTPMHTTRPYQEGNSSTIHLPRELWIDIFRACTTTPGELETGWISPLDDLTDRERFLSVSASTKSKAKQSIITVCRTWYLLAAQFAYETVSVTSLAQLLQLRKATTSGPGIMGLPSPLSYCKRFQLRLTSPPNGIQALHAAVHLAAIWKLSPNIRILHLDIASAANLQCFSLLSMFLETPRVPLRKLYCNGVKNSLPVERVRHMLEQLGEIQDMKIHIATSSSVPSTRDGGDTSEIPSHILAFPRLHTLFIPPWLLGELNYRWSAPQLKHISINPYLCHSSETTEFFAKHGPSVRALTFSAGCQRSEHLYIEPFTSVGEVIHDIQEVPKSLYGLACTRIGVTATFKFDPTSVTWGPMVELLVQNFARWADIGMFPRLHTVRLLGLTGVDEWDEAAAKYWRTCLSIHVTKGIRVEDREGRLVDAILPSPSDD